MVKPPKEEGSKVLQNVEQIELSKPAPIYDIPPAYMGVAGVEAAQLAAELNKARNLQSPRAREENHFESCMAELIFQGILYQFEIPNVRNPVFMHEPNIEWREYDFLTPIGTIDVKAISPGQHYKLLLINKQRWDTLQKNPEVIVAIKLLDNYKRGQIFGYMRGSAVKFPYMEKFHIPGSPDSEIAYSVKLDDYRKLKPGNELIETLRKNVDLPKNKWGCLT